jgi:hypothetical protein
MRLITLTDEKTGVTVQCLIGPDELAVMSGVQLAALLYPNPSAEAITTLNEFLDHYRGRAS